MIVREIPKFTKRYTKPGALKMNEGGVYPGLSTV